MSLKKEKTKNAYENEFLIEEENRLDEDISREEKIMVKEGAETCMEEDMLPGQPRYFLSLDFHCDQTHPSQRRICEQFWNLIDQHPEFERIVARGWSDILNDDYLERDDIPGKKKRESKTPCQSPCDDLREFMNHQADIPALVGVNKRKSTCVTAFDDSESTKQLFSELEEFDSRLVTEQTAPPPRSTRHTRPQKNS